MSHSNVTIASIGSMNVDLITFCKRFPSPGETLIGDMFQMGPGGKGANQCACAALLSGSSSNVAMIGAVGDDVFGSNYLTSFATSNVVIEGLVDIIPGISTGVAPITVDEKGENSIIVVPGANNRMTVSRTIEKLDSLTNLRCALFQLEIPNDVTLACMKRCIERGINTFFTPAPVPPTGLSDEFFQWSSVVIPNLGEALQLCGGVVEGDIPSSTTNGGGKDKDSSSSSSSSSSSISTSIILTEAEVRIERAIIAAKKILSRGAKAVCVTLGSHGVVLVMNEDINDNNKKMMSSTTTSSSTTSTTRILAIPAPRVTNVVDTTGAGDAFSGSFAFFYSHLCRNSSSPTSTTSSVITEQESLQWDILVSAAKRAVYVASISVTKKGTQSSYSKRRELPNELFDENWILPTEI
jgi:ribokinase